MDLFELAAKITLDSSGYEKSIKSAADSSKTAQAAVNSLITPVEKAKAAFDAIKHPVETAKAGWDNLKSSVNGFIHPIQTAKNKMDEAKTTAQKQQSIMAGLAAKYDDTKKTVEKLTDEYKKSVKESGNTSKESIKLAQKLDQAEKEAAQAEQAMKEYADSVKKTGDETDKAEKKTSKFADALKKSAGAIAKGSVAAIGAAGAAIGKIVYDSVQAYSEYEQLAGGISKLYGAAGMTIDQYAKSVGKNVWEVGAEYDKLNAAQALVMKNAQNAYKTAGMSASQYMETATQFSASLINSLGGDTLKAAEQTDVAMRAISDNYNTFGGDIQSIQNAYMGFAKQNYMMLDNLKLGYAGTKTGMEQLIADANEYAAANGKAANLSIDSFADIVTAIELVQEKQGIAGTTAKEAATTIQGSLNMTKAAWENLLTGLSDPDADIGQLADNLVSSFGSLANNIVPVVSRALEGVGNAISTILPTLIPQVVKLITDNLPMLTKTAISMIKTLTSALTDNMDSIIDAAFEIINTLVEYLVDPDGLATLIDAAIEILAKLATSLGEQLPILLPAIANILANIVEKLSAPENISMLVEAAIALLMGLANGLISYIGVLLDRAPQIVMSLVSAIIENAPKLLEAAGELLETLWDGLKNVGQKMLEIGDKIVKGIWNGISNGYQWIKSKIEGWVGNIMDFFKNILGIHSPSRWAQNVIGKNIVLGMAEGLDDNADAVYDSINDLVDGASDAATMGLDGINPALNVGEASITKKLAIDSPETEANIGAVFSLLQYYLPLLTNRQIVLDSGATVGALAAQMDDALGRRTILAARGMA